MRVVIDLQGVQESMCTGRPADDLLQLVRTMLGERGEHEVLLALNGFRPDTVDAVRSAVAGLLPADRIRVWYAEGPVNEADGRNAVRRQWARCLRGAFLRSLQPHVLLVTGAFAGFSEDAVTLPDDAVADLPTVFLLEQGEPRPRGQDVSAAAWERFVRTRLELVAQASAWVQLAGTAAGIQLQVHAQEPAPAGACQADWSAVAKRMFAVLGSVARAPGAPGNPVRELVERIAGWPRRQFQDARLDFAARAIAANHPARRKRHLYLDISGVLHNDLKTGIQRVTRSIVAAMLGHPPEDYLVVPVYARPGQQGFFQAESYLWQVQGRAGTPAPDRAIDAQPGDVFVALDFVHWVAVTQQRLLEWMRNHGVRVYFVVYDLLPVRFPQYFPAQSPQGHEEWLRIVSRFDGGICISRSVQHDLDEWLKAHGLLREGRFRSGWFHLGADVEASQPSLGLPADGEDVLQALAAAPTFLMVGTLEPRKGYRQVLAAFELLWAQGRDVNLAIVGKAGWMMEDLAETLRAHPELNRHLFWPPTVSDEYLDRIYAACSSLIAASECEGFGLPLIEAARKGLPVIARDIPVFREVAGDHAFYFSGEAADELAAAIDRWLALRRDAQHPQSGAMPWLTWEQSAQQLLASIA